ncbi:MAG: hypothetical protein IJZ33_00890 [Clostridia bacterium]|nr:hypothetical protein [Clostridia bacterium]
MKNGKLFKKNVALLLAVLFLCMSFCSCNSAVTTEHPIESTPSHKETGNSSLESDPTPSEDPPTPSVEPVGPNPSPTPSAEPVDPNPSPTHSLSLENEDVALKYIMMQGALNDFGVNDVGDYVDFLAYGTLMSADIPDGSKSIFYKTLGGVTLTWLIFSEWGFVDKNLMGDEYEIVLCYRQSPKDNSDKEDRWFCIERVDSRYVRGVDGWCYLTLDITDLAFVDVLEEWCAEKDEVEVDIQMWILYDGESDGIIFDFYTTKGKEITSGFVEGILETPIAIKIDKESLSQVKEWIEDFRSESDQSD